MDRDEALKLLRGGPEGIKEWNNRRSEESVPRLHHADFRGADLHGMSLRDVDLDDADLRGAQLARADLEQARLRNVNLDEANLQNASLDGADLRDAVLRRAGLRDARLHKASLLGTDLSSADLSGAVVTHAALDGAVLALAKLVNAQVQGASLRRCDFQAADLRGANFQEADLTRANLTGVSVNVNTNFLRAKVMGCVIDRHALESLNAYGGLTNGDRMNMRIVDGVATLRASYSGFLQWIHVIALLAFLFPYLAFVLRRWFEAKFTWTDEQTTIALWEALFRFIWNGGQNWQIGWDLAPFPFALFALSAFYNLLRGFLLWKTKKLELTQQASGLPAVFSLTGFWGRAYRIAEWGFYANLIVVAIHSFHFLCQRIPLS